MRNTTIDLITNKAMASLYRDLIGSKWEVEVSGSFFSFVRYIRIVESCHQLNMSITLWKVNAGFDYECNYQAKYKEIKLNKLYANCTVFRSTYCRLCYSSPYDLQVPC